MVLQPCRFLTGCAVWPSDIPAPQSCVGVLRVLSLSLSTWQSWWCHVTVYVCEIICCCVVWDVQPQLSQSIAVVDRIPYYLSFSRQYPGKFLLSYLPRKSPRHEFVTVTPEGIRYRSRTFPTLASMVRWFKEHFRDPIPGQSLASFVVCSTFYLRTLLTFWLWPLTFDLSRECLRYVFFIWSPGSVYCLWRHGKQTVLDCGWPVLVVFDPVV